MLISNNISYSWAKEVTELSKLTFIIPEERGSQETKEESRWLDDKELPHYLNGGQVNRGEYIRALRQIWAREV